jgi:hypothetical protein
MHSMRNQPGSPTRRSLGFEGLEDRHLLSGGPFVGPRPEVVIAGPTVPWSFERLADFAAVEIVAIGTHGDLSTPGGGPSWEENGLADRSGSLFSPPGQEPSFAPVALGVALPNWARSSELDQESFSAADQPAFHLGPGPAPLAGVALADQPGPSWGPGTGSDAPSPFGGGLAWRGGGGPLVWAGKGAEFPSGGASFFAVEKDLTGGPEPFYLLRAESQAPEFPGLNPPGANPPGANPSGATGLAAYFSSQGNRPELSETEAASTPPGSPLVGSNPMGPQYGVAPIVGNTTGPASGGPSAPVATVSGGLPAQPGSVLDAGGTAERSWSASAARDWSLGIGTVPPGGTLAVPIRNTAAPTSTTRHWSLRPATVGDIPVAKGREEGLALQGADLIAAAVPFDQASLEAALDQFVRQLDDQDIRRLAARGPAPIAVVALTALGTVASLEFARRFWRRQRLVAQGIAAGYPVLREIPLGFPELPGSWSERGR